MQHLRAMRQSSNALQSRHEIAILWCDEIILEQIRLDWNECGEKRVITSGICENSAFGLNAMNCLSLRPIELVQQRTRHTPKNAHKHEVPSLFAVGQNNRRPDAHPKTLVVPAWKRAGGSVRHSWSLIDWATSDAETTPHLFMAFIAFFFMAGAAGAAALFIAFADVFNENTQAQSFANTM